MSNVLAFRQPDTVRPEATGKGFALIHRKIQDCEFYKKDSEAVHLWFHLIMMANHAAETVMTDYGDVVVGRGQLITGRDTLVRETGIELERVKYLLRKFKKLEMISSYSPGKFSLITVLKYDEYQGKSFPQDSPEIPPPIPCETKPVAMVVPQDSLVIPTNNNLLNNSFNKLKESVSAGEISEKKKPTHSCQDVIDAYHRILPECPSVRAISDKRRNLIKTFWVKAGKITRQLDSAPFSMQAWEDYLKYISQSCRWMLGTRPDAKTGRMWRCKNIDYLLSDEVYLKVREGNSDDV
ncbi:Uncharacterised protein [Yersinia mollaretii]|uniref:hypothetical protein n=1 Tax=Yersinia mollaretii TaxID=33060 RepID=UPI0005E3BB40|nr:hypothetical protein [Yersinia mollaretii]CNK69111.1 Uncharacterised protein [Yersinia mollaretii]